ncbi:hypothetical protein ACJ73_07976, partial [Blastomyces percursus]
MNYGRDLHRQNIPLAEEAVILAHQLQAYRADSQPWVDQLTDETLALLHCIYRNYEPKQPPTEQSLSTLPTGRRNLRSKTRSAAPETPSGQIVYSPDWPIDRSCLNKAVNKLHGLTRTLTSTPAYIEGANVYIGSLSVRTIERLLGPKTNKTPSRLVISASSSSPSVHPSPDVRPANVERLEDSQSQATSSNSQSVSPPLILAESIVLPRNVQASTSTPAESSTPTESTESIPRRDVRDFLFEKSTPVNPASNNMAQHAEPSTGAFSRAQQEVLDSMFNQILSRLDQRQNDNGPSTASEPPATVVQATTAYWKATDIGIFWPEAQGDEDVLDKDSKTYYRDVFSFTTRLRVAAQTKDPAIIRHDIALCLKGSANTWWTMELDDVTRYGLINHPNGVQAICDKLEKRFRQAPSKALAKFEQMTYTIQDAQNGRSVAAYAAELVAQAKQCGFADSPDILVLQIWRHLDLPLRLNIDEPSPGTSVEAFVQELTRKESNWADRAYLLQGRFPARYGNNPSRYQNYGARQDANQDRRYRGYGPSNQERRFIPYENINRDTRPAPRNPYPYDNPRQSLPATAPQKFLPATAANFEDLNHLPNNRQQHPSNVNFEDINRQGNYHQQHANNGNIRRPNYQNRNTNQHNS